MNQTENIQMPITIKRRFLELPALWLKIGEMNENFFSSELQHTSISNTLFSVLLVTASTAIITLIAGGLGFITGYAHAPASTNLVGAVQTAGILTIVLDCISAIIIPLMFYLDNGIAFISALIFGGKGKYSSQTYLDSLYYVPLAILGGLIGLLAAIPKAGLYIVAVLTLGIAIYALVLRVRVFKIVHEFGTARAIVSVLAPLVLLLIPVCAIILLVIMGPIIGNIFSTINSRIGMPT